MNAPASGIRSPSDATADIARCFAGNIAFCHLAGPGSPQSLRSTSFIQDLPTPACPRGLHQSIVIGALEDDDLSDDDLPDLEEPDDDDLHESPLEESHDDDLLPLESPYQSLINYAVVHRMCPHPHAHLDIPFPS